ncbi:hypothetical protein [Pedobacter sp.]|uniref:hypothetical protein n=1 Tax=Pedobacter sp. TaxID=1411316 RepID=UPI003D7F5F0A
MNKYQVRIRKALTDEQKNEFFGEELGSLGTATQIRKLTGQFDDMAQAFEKMANVPELAEWEVISVILVDEDNREQLGEDFKWEDE